MNSVKFHLYLLALGVLYSAGALSQTSNWLSNAEPVVVMRGAKANWSVGSQKEVNTSNFFVIAKAVGASARIDLTPIASLKDNILELDLGLISVPAGQYAIEISHINASGTLEELDRTELTVTATTANTVDKEKTVSDIEPATNKFEFKPKLDLAARGQLYERRSADAGVSARPRYKDLTLEAGFETLNSSEDWELKTSFSLSGSSYGPEAVQFSTKGVEASKIDLTNYLIEGGTNTTRFALGNISVTTNPLLVQSISNRGVSVSGKLPMGFDLSASVQNGGGVQVGLDQLMGIAAAGLPLNSFKQVSLGVDVDQDNPGRTRLDFTRMTARQHMGVLATGGDAVEKSEGHGLRFSGRSQEGRARLELVVATSQQTPAGTEVTSNHGHAWTSELGYDVLKDWAWRTNLPVSLTAGFRLEHSSPLYRSLGSSYGSNYRQQVGLFTVKAGPAQAQGQISRRYDNVDADPAYLRNKVSAWSLNANIPIDLLLKAWQEIPESPNADAAGETEAGKAELAKSAQLANKPNPYWPSLTYQRKSTLGFGDPAFVPIGYTADDLPMVHVLEQALGLRWAFERAQIGIKRLRVEQDNRQVGHENEDVTDNKWGYSLDYKASDTLTLGFSHDLSHNLRYITGIVGNQFQSKASVTYNLTPDTVIVADLNRTLARDTTMAINRLTGYQLQWTTKFKTPIFGGGNELPGQFYFRYLVSNGYVSSINSSATTPATYALQVGVNFSFF